MSIADEVAKLSRLQGKRDININMGIAFEVLLISIAVFFLAVAIKTVGG